MTNSAKVETILHVYNSLGRLYGKLRKKRDRDPFEQLILCILTHRAHETPAQECLEVLKKKYVDWNEARVSTENELGELLADKGIDSTTASLLKRALETISAKRYKIDLDFIEGVSADDAREKLTALDAVPQDIAWATVLACYENVPVPVDEDVARLVQRLGAVKSTSSIKTVTRLVRKAIDRSEALNFYRVFTWHAQAVCREDSPDCTNCIVRKTCKHGTRVIEEARAQRKAAKKASGKSSKKSAKKKKKKTRKKRKTSKKKKKTKSKKKSGKKTKKTGKKKTKKKKGKKTKKKAGGGS